MKITWFNKNILGFGLASFFNDFCHEMSTAILPTFISQIVGINAAPLFLGIIEGIADVASTGMKLLSGWLADKVKFYKPYLILGYGATPIFVFLIGTAHSVWPILFYRIIAWMSKGIREPIRDTWLSKITKSIYYGRAFGFTRALDTCGAIMGPLVTFFLLKLYSLRTIFFIAFIPGACSVLSLMLISEHKEQNIKSSNINFIQHMKKLPNNFKYFLLIMFIFGIGNFHQILLIYRAQEVFLGYSYSHFSSIVATGWSILFYTFFNVIRAISEFSIGTISDFKNRKNLLAILGFGTFALTSICFMINTQQLWFWFFIFALAGLSVGTVKVLEKAYAASMLSEDIRGTGLGILQTIDGVGDLISSAVVGILWSLFSPIIGLLYAAILSFIAMIFLLIKK